MAYYGSGTQTDPYIVDNWEDLKAVSATKDVYVRLDPNAECKVMDINETSDALGLQANLPFYANIEGNGWEIRNLCTGSFDIRTNGNTITDLHFVNLICGALRVFWGSVFCTNCSFSILFLKRGCICVPNGGASFNYCAMNLFFVGTEASTLFYALTTLTGCDIELHGSVKGLKLLETGKMEDCRITGQLHLDDAELTLGSYNKTTAYNIFSVELTGSGQVLSKYTSNSICLVNTEQIAEEITVTLLDNWVGVTTSQLQDADYLLNTLYFPCAVEA